MALESEHIVQPMSSAWLPAVASGFGQPATALDIGFCGVMQDLGLQLSAAGLFDPALGSELTARSNHHGRPDSPLSSGSSQIAETSLHTLVTARYMAAVSADDISSASGNNMESMRW
jgi:hypothetical protein